MNYNLDKVIPPPATFAADMTQTESAIMSKHIAYWADLLNKDVAVAFGPVADGWHEPQSAPIRRNEREEPVVTVYRLR